MHEFGPRADSLDTASLTLLSVSEENFPRNLQLIDTIVEIAKKKKVTPSQLTLAWLLAQGEDIFPVCTQLLSQLYISTQFLALVEASFLTKLLTPH